MNRTTHESGSKTPGVGLDRRTFLGACCAGVGVTIVGPGRSSMPGDTVPAIVEWLLRDPAGDGLARAAAYLREGGDEGVLLDAVGTAAATAIPSDVPRFNHIALATHSVRQLIDAMPLAQRRLRCLWLVRAFHYERDRVANGWRQVEREPRVVHGDPTEPLVAALDAWDADHADQAVVDFAALRGAAAVLGVVRPYGLRCQANLGHKVIHLAAVENLLPRLAEPQRIVVLRALVRSLFIHGRSDRSNTFADARRLARRAVDREGAKGGLDAVATAMRKGAPGAALHAMADTGTSGLAWDAVLIQAAETTLAQHGVAPVHATTTAIAMAALARTHAGPVDGELARLQAAAFQAWFRAAPAAEPDSLRLATVAAKPLADGDSLLARAARSAANPTPGALPGILALPPRDRASLVVEFRRHIVGNAVDLHHVKIGAGVLATLPSVGEMAGAALLAAALLHAPPPHQPLDPRLQRLQNLLDG